MIPVIISVVRGRERLSGAKFYLGKRFGMFCNVYVAQSSLQFRQELPDTDVPENRVTIAWYIFAIPLLSFPTTIPVLANTMNCRSTLQIPSPPTTLIDPNVSSSQTLRPFTSALPAWP